MSKRLLRKAGKEASGGAPRSEFVTAVAIRNLRKELSLTQLDLARRIEITPTSVYRYEAGTSLPNIETLSRLCDLARETASPTLSLEFGRLLWARVGPRNEGEVQDSARILSISEEQKLLAPEQRLLAMAFIRMLRESSDMTAERVFAVLLEPWVEKIRNGPGWNAEQGEIVAEEGAKQTSKSRVRRNFAKKKRTGS